VVTPLEDGTGRYGAGWSQPYQPCGRWFPHALVQIVQPDDPGLSLKTWNHVVWELRPSRFVGNIEAIPEIEMVQLDGETPKPDLFDDCGLAGIHVCDGRTYTLCTEARELVRRIDLLNAVVDTYREAARLDRTNVHTVEPLINIYPGLSGLVIFPRFKVHDLLRLAGQGYLLPAGITRFTISPRALHLNYPLEELEADKPIEEKNAELQRWLQDRLSRKGVRYYAEATFLFDE
jgi:hypothetical protein